MRKVVRHYTDSEGHCVVTDDGLLFRYSVGQREWVPETIDVPIPQFDVEQPMFILPKDIGETFIIQTWTGSAIKLEVFQDGSIRLNANTNFKIRIPEGLDLSPAETYELPTVFLKKGAP